MSKNTLEQVKELLKHIQENPEALKKLEELSKSAKKDPQAQPIFSEKIIKPSDKDAVVLNPNAKKPLANAEDSKQVEMEMSPQDHEKKRVGELAKRIKACIEKMEMDKMQKESMDKDDKPHASGTPEDKAHDVAEEGESVKQAIHELKDKSADSKQEMLSHLRTLKDKSQLRNPENREAGKESHEKSELNKSVHGVPGKNRPLHSRGVNEPVSVSTPKFAQDAKEKSLLGLKVRRKDIPGAKDAAKEILSELRAMKKPNLPKAELEKQLMSPPFSMTEKSKGYYRDLVKRCWEGYEPTPGKKAYTKGSCRPAKKTELEKAKIDEVLPKNLNEKIKNLIDTHKAKQRANRNKFSSTKIKGVHQDKGTYSKLPEGAKKIAATYGVATFDNNWKSIENQLNQARRKKSKDMAEEIKNMPEPKLKSELGKEQMIPVPKPKLPMPIIGGSDNGDSKKPKKPVKKPLMNSELEKEDLQAIPKKVLVEEMSGDPKEKGSLKQHSYWKTPGKEGSYPRTKFNAAASDKMRLLDMMTGKYKMHGPKGILKSEKTEYYEGLIKSVLEKAKIIAGPGRQEKPGTVLGESKTKNLKFKDYEKEQKSIDLFNQIRNNPTKENIQAFQESQKIDLKEKPKKKTTKAPSAKSVKKTEGLEKKQKVLIHGRVKYVDATPDAPHEVLAYNIKQSAKGRKKRKPKKTQVRKSEQYYQDLIKKVLDN